MKLPQFTIKLDKAFDKNMCLEFLNHDRPMIEWTFPEIKNKDNAESRNIISEKINERYLGLLVTTLENCGVRIEDTADGRGCSLVLQTESGNYDETAFCNAQTLQELNNNIQYLEAKKQKLASDLEFLQKTYGLYSAVCKKAARGFAELVNYCRLELIKEPYIQSALSRLNRILCGLTRDLAQKGSDIIILYFEELPEGEDAKQWFNMVERGYSYPAVLKDNKLFFDAYGHVRKKSA
jgi:hypothetical protein